MATSWEDVKPRAYQTLKDVFGFQSFRGVQEDAVRAALEGRDTFVLMPTGGGKSLCYALPAVMRDGLVLVVSPLIALMQDQVAGLQALGIAADYLSSTRTAAERRAVLGRLAAGGAKLDLLYVTPELLATDNFRQQLVGLHSSRTLQLLAIDEAHCISQWGHDFRPTYRQLAGLRGQLPGLPCMALTATATAQVQQDILSSLRMQRPVKLVTSFNRPNIHYSVVLLDVQRALPSTAVGAGNSRRVAGGSSSSPADSAAPGTANQASTESSVGRNQSSKGSGSSRIGSAGAGSRAAVSIGAGIGQQGLGFIVGADDGDDDDDIDDVDFAGYEHLLRLLKPVATTDTDPPSQHSTPETTGSRREGGQEQQHGRHWQGPISIVYALKRNTVDVLVRRLGAAGVCVAGYHAALPDAVRAGVLQRWRAGQLQVVVATVAFGMGVDKGDIQLVVHFNLPRSVESFYQESGRAGRNGQPASSVLFYSTRDRRRMDWILQKDADSKAARKRKKAVKAATEVASATTQQLTGQNNSTAGAGTVDPAAAAAALRAFGAVVDLCTQPGCRRVRLLKHFGEDFQPAQQQMLQQQPTQTATVSDSSGRARCCDYCDSPTAVSSAVQQLKEQEVQLLQRWSRGGAGSKRQKWGAGGGMFGDGGIGGSSDEEDGSGAGYDSDDDIELDLDSVAVAAATAAAKAAAATRGAGKAGRAGATDAFLSAMLKAEQQHNRQQAASAAAGGGDPLQRLLAAKESSGNKQVPGAAPGSLLASVRASRRAKLAELISSNHHLPDCSPEAAAVLAAALEGTVCSNQPNINAAQHRAGVAKLAAAVKAASGWLELPALQQLQGKALGIVLKAAVQAVLRSVVQLQHAAGDGAAAVERQLLQLSQLPVTVSVLEETGVAQHIKALRKHQQQQIAAAASKVIADWRAAVS